MIRTAIGVALVLLGIIAAITPLTPGSWLVPIGLEILGIRLIIQRRLIGSLPGWIRPYLDKFRHKDQVHRSEK